MKEGKKNAQFDLILLIKWKKNGSKIPARPKQRKLTFLDSFHCFLYNALFHKNSLKELVYYSVDNKHDWKDFTLWEKTRCSGLQRTRGEAQEVTTRPQRQNLHRLQGVWLNRFRIWP